MNYGLEEADLRVGRPSVVLNYGMISISKGSGEHLHGNPVNDLKPSCETNQCKPIRNQKEKAPYRAEYAWG